jgi:hypothetical protein
MIEGVAGQFISIADIGKIANTTLFKNSNTTPTSSKP